MARPLYLSDRNKRTATLDVHGCDGRFEGIISLQQAPSDLCRLFERWEEVVEGQMFSLLDDIEERIAAQDLRVVLDDGTTADVEDLQVFPSSGTVSFKIKQRIAVK
jgi:hypothetical protein